MSISDGNSLMLPDDPIDGGDNLICNSGFPTSTTGWGYQIADEVNYKLSLSKHSFYYNNTENMFVLSNNTTVTVHASSTRFKVKRNTKYSLNIALFATSNIKGVDIYFLGREIGQKHYYTRSINVKRFNSSPSTTGVYSLHAIFETENTDEGYIRIDNIGTNNSSNSLLFFSEVDVYEGTSPRAYNTPVKCVNNKQTISRQGNKLVLSNGGGEVDLPTNNTTTYDDTDIKRRLSSLEGRTDNDNQTLSLDSNKRRLSISNGNNVVLPNDKQSLNINGNTLSLSNGGGSVNIPQPNLSGYVTTVEYNKIKRALESILTNLKTSGAWNQTGGTIFEGSLRPDRNIATGNINLFGGSVDGNAFIRTNNSKTENDLAGGIN